MEGQKVKEIRVNEFAEWKIVQLPSEEILKSGEGEDIFDAFRIARAELTKFIGSVGRRQKAG